uniref:Uncharacterized protein n=1 Tax=Sphenodon punctatus TaxID=8508 RepID=A0A8D0H261_SPHPU
MASSTNPNCYAQCPPSTVTIQPPPFVLTIPGPALYCPNQPFGIEQHNPCAGITPRGGGMEAIAYNDDFGSNFSSFYDRSALPGNTYGNRSFYRSY